MYHQGKALMLPLAQLAYTQKGPIEMHGMLFQGVQVWNLGIPFYGEQSPYGQIQLQYPEDIKPEDVIELAMQEAGTILAKRRVQAFNQN